MSKHIFPKIELYIQMRVFRNIKRSVATVDLFQAPIIIKFQGREKNSTYFGVIFSLAIIIFLSIYFSNADIFQKQSPKIVNLDVVNANRPLISYSNKLFAISLSDESSISYSDFSIFTFQVTNRYMKVDPAGSGFYFVKNVTRTLHECTPEELDNNWYYSLGLKGSYCLDDNFFETVGFWDEDQVVYLEINVQMCDNKTSKVTCKSTTDVQKFLDGKVFNIYYEGVNVNPTNYTSPMNAITYNDYYTMDYTLRKMVNIYLKKINIQTDDGWLVSDTHNLGNIIFDSKEIDLMSTTSSSSEETKNLLFQCNFYSSRNSQNLQREYQKLLDALSDLGGIANMVMIFGFIITSIENSFTLKKKVMNSLYSFQDIDKYKEKVESRKNSKSEANFEMQEKSFKLDEIPTSLKFTKSETTIRMPKKEKKAVFNDEKDMIIFENLDVQKENITNEISYKKQENPINEPVVLKSILSRARIADENKESFEQIPKKEIEKETEISKKVNLSPNIDTFNHVPDEDIRNYFEGTSPNIDMDEHAKSFMHTPRDLPSFTKLNIKPVSSRKTIIKAKNTKIEKKIKNLEQYEEFLRQSSSKLNMNFIEYLVLYFKQMIKVRLSEKEQLFLKGIKVYNEELDIVHILKKVQEIEKMKLVLFNEDQRILFNMIDKPMIYLDENGQFLSQETGSGQLKMSRITNSATIMDENRMKKIFERLTSMHQNDEMTMIDRRLMDLVEKKLTEFMKNF